MKKYFLVIEKDNEIYVFEKLGRYFRNESQNNFPLFSKLTEDIFYFKEFQDKDSAITESHKLKSLMSMYDKAVHIFTQEIKPVTYIELLDLKNKLQIKKENIKDAFDPFLKRD